MASYSQPRGALVRALLGRGGGWRWWWWWRWWVQTFGEQPRHKLGWAPPSSSGELHKPSRPKERAPSAPPSSAPAAPPRSDPQAGRGGNLPKVPAWRRRCRCTFSGQTSHVAKSHTNETQMKPSSCRADLSSETEPGHWLSVLGAEQLSAPATAAILSAAGASPPTASTVVT